MRVALSLAVLVVAGALALELSGSSPRTAGSNHVGTPIFSAVVPAGGRVCQAVPPLPNDAAYVQALIGSYSHQVPALAIRFVTGSGTVVAEGAIAAGATEGIVTIPVVRVRRGDSTSACLQVGPTTKVAIGGEGYASGAGSEIINGTSEPGRIGLSYFRHGRESWWELLPSLTTRFGFGKASFMGAWTLPVTALALLALWAGAIRLLVRELT